MSLKFYSDEQARWPELHNAPISDQWAHRALKKLTRHFKADQMPYGIGPVNLEFGRAGTSWSWGGVSGIKLAKTRDWLVFLHEFAHVYEWRRYGKTEHRRRMAQIVDRVCRYALKMGWPQADTDEQFAQFGAGPSVAALHADPAPATGDTSRHARAHASNPTQV